MSSKRSRVVRSSSLGEIGLFNQIQPIDSPVSQWEKKRAAPVNIAKPVQKSVKNSKPSVVILERSRKSILTLGSPVKDTSNEGSERKVDERFGVFFQACFYCKTKIPDENDVFMYGYLQAFCSPTCRDKKISMDEKENKTSSESMKVAENFLPNGVAKRGFGAQAKKKYSVAKFK